MASPTPLLASTALVSQHCCTVNSILIPRLLAEHPGTIADENIIDLSTAENWLLRAETLMGIMQPTALAGLTQQSLSYAGGIGGPIATRKAFAHLLNRYFEPRAAVTSEQIVLAAGASAALSALIEQICEPGTSVLMATPYWSGLDLCLQERNGVEVVEVSGEPPERQIDSQSVHDKMENSDRSEGAVRRLVQRHERALAAAHASSVKVKALILCNPTNPTGQCFTRTELAALLALCARKNLHLISDEVFALSVHGSAQFVSALSLDGSAVDDGTGRAVDMRSRLHVIYSLSKDFGCSGIRLGAVITQSATPILLACALALQSQVSVFTALIANNTLLEPEKLSGFLATNASRLAAAYSLVRNFLQRYAIPYVPAQAGVYVFAKLCRYNDCTWEDESALLQRVRHHKVNIVAGRTYHCTWPGWFRIALAFPEEVMLQALPRIRRAIEDYEMMTSKVT